MNRRGLVAVVALLVLVSLIGAGLAISVVGSGPVAAGSFFGDSSERPALEYFQSAGARCTEDFMANSSTSVVSGPDTTRITYSRNVSLPGPSYAIGGPTFERVNDTTYVLDVPIEETEKAPRTCPGVARYNGTMRIPAGNDPWQIIVTHDGERVTTLYGDSDQSLLGGSASVGQRVSDSDSAADSTTSPE